MAALSQIKYSKRPSVFECGVTHVIKVVQSYSSGVIANLHVRSSPWVGWSLTTVTRFLHKSIVSTALRGRPPGIVLLYGQMYAHVCTLGHHTPSQLALTRELNHKLNTPRVYHCPPSLCLRRPGKTVTERTSAELIRNANQLS